MKFPRRPDLDPPTRIQIVMLAWRHQGVYGKMTHIATYYRISRTLLYHLLLAANRQLAVLFSDETLLLQKDQQPFEHLLLLFRLEGNCSLLSISAILQALDYPPHSVGALRLRAFSQQPDPRQRVDQSRAVLLHLFRPE